VGERGMRLLLTETRLLAVNQTLVDRTGDVGAAIIVLLLVLLASHALLAAAGSRHARMLFPIIVPLFVLSAAVVAVRLYWLAS
jgi:hypothetical protein